MDFSNNLENREKLARRNYIKWGDPNAEKVPEGEAEDIEAVAADQCHSEGSVQLSPTLLFRYG
jgi:hypothetical protein